MRRFPLINFVILFCTGILAEYYFKVLPDTVFYIIPGLFFISIIIYFIKKFPLRLILLNISIYVLVFIIGALHFKLDLNSVVSYPFEQARVKNVNVYGEVTSTKLPQQKKISFTLSVDSLKNVNGTSFINFNLLCNLKDITTLKIYSI